MVEALVKALLLWADASRKEGIARKDYVGTDFEGEAVELVQKRLAAKARFDEAFRKFVDVLVANG